MYKILTGVILAAAFSAVGCDVDVNENATDTPAENRMERREERRENVREAVDGVDVEVGNGGVKVDVD